LIGINTVIVITRDADVLHSGTAALAVEPHALGFRKRLYERGMAWLEALGFDIDRPLIRRLAEDGADAARIKEM
jgi:hypothetical protein